MTDGQAGDRTSDGGDLMETIAVPFQSDAADRLKRAAAEIGMPLEAFIASAAEQFVTDNEARLGEPLSPEQVAAIERGLADVAAGQTSSHSEVFEELKDRFAR
jgi:predicted transcriptional regulator|tara:strand:+ start:85 stop:393 length:309 start_codon:yes stop_codon:yes gene_type:complete